MALSYSVSDPIKSHDDGSIFFCFAVPLIMLLAAVLSVATGVGGCWWPISARSVIMDLAFWKFPNNPPNSTSVADSITFLIMIHSTCTGKFLRKLIVLVCWI